MPKIIFVIALALSPFAGAIAFIITYQEYARHLVDKTRVVRIGPDLPRLAFPGRAEEGRITRLQNRLTEGSALC